VNLTPQPQYITTMVFFSNTNPFTVDDIPNNSLVGRIIFITGGNGGLGKESAYQLCRKGAKVYIGARAESKARAAINEIKSKVPCAEIEFIPLDLTSFESVKTAADTYLTHESTLHVLMNNAGIMMTDFSQTKEGYEIQFGTNHMGHFLLTKLLLPTLESTAKTAPPGTVRIVNLSSAGHNLGLRGIPFNNFQNISPFTQERYGVSKLANILHAKALAQKYSDKGITAVSLHPGIIASDLYVPYTNSNFVLRNAYKVMKRVTKSIEDGAVNQIWCAVGNGVKNGGYYDPVEIEGGSILMGLSRHAKSQGNIDKLWERSEEECKKHGY